jgi:hypothetical protein
MTSPETTLPAWMRLQLPPEAQDVQAAYEEGMDNFAMIRFQVPEGVVNDLLSSLGFAKPLKEGFKPFPQQGEELAWWQPYAEGPFYGVSVLVDGLSRELVARQLGDGQALIYLRTYQV